MELNVGRNRWNKSVPLFCESVLSGPPEIHSCLTSIVISLVGVYGCLSSKSNHLVQHWYSLLIFNGIASFGFHYTGSWGWGKLDLWSEVILGCSVVSGVSNSLIPRSKKLTAAILTALINGIAILTIALDSSEVGIDCDLIIGGLLLAGLVLFLWSLETVHHKSLKTNPQKRLMMAYLNLMSVTILGSMAIWVIQERWLCKNIPRFWSKVPMHALWHIGSSYGLML
ncbi:hypothetical protein HK098_007378, partial [Nowakowskiella sp. JEL0407]